MVLPKIRHALRAIDPVSGRIVWEQKNPAPLWAGVLATASNLVFTGTPEGYLKAFDAKTEEELWKFQAGSGVTGSPVTWEQDGEQYIAVVSGWGGAVPLWGGEVAKIVKDYYPRRQPLTAMNVLWGYAPANGARGAASAIHFLPAEGERSHWHRVDAAEIWLWLAGATLLLEVHATDGCRNSIRVGAAAGEGETFQGIVPPHAWQAASSLGAWTLVNCIVTPGFQFEGFELLPPDWRP